MAEKKLVPDLSRQAYTNLAIVFGLVGLAVAYINTRYLIAGLTKMESDPDMLSIAILSGVVIIVCDLLFFTTAAYLSWQHVVAWKLKLILAGFVILCAEIMGMYGAMKGIDAKKTFAAEAVAEQAKTLQDNVNAKTNATQVLADNAKGLQGSKHTWAKVAAGSQLEKTLKEDPTLVATTAEIARVKASREPTMADIYGEWAPWVIIGKAVFYAVLGLITVGASGFFLRKAREVSPVVSVPMETKRDESPVTAKRPPAADMRQKNDGYTGVSMRGPGLAAALGVGGMAAAFSPNAANAAETVQVTKAPLASETPRSTVQDAATSGRSTGTNAATSGRSMEESNATISGRSNEVGKAAENASTEENTTKKRRVSRKDILATGGKVDSGVTPGSDSRYQRVKALILSRQIKPSIRAVQAREGGSDPIVSRYLAQMETEGLLVKTPSGRYTIAPRE